MASVIAPGLAALAAGCPLHGPWYLPEPAPAGAPVSRYHTTQSEESDAKSAAAAETQERARQDTMVDVDALRKFVLESSGLDEATVDALLTSDDRYLALLGCMDWSVVFDSEEELERERLRLGFAGPRDGSRLPEYTEEGLAQVASDFGVAPAAVTEFYELHSQFLQAAGLMASDQTP